MALEPITRKEKIIAGQDLTPITRMEKFLKQYGGGGGGGSSDAVLYTPQTLTDAQKKQARENVDAASYFVITATVNSSMDGVTLDKTESQIKEAISAGKTPVIRVLGGDTSFYLPLIRATGTIFIFGTVIADEYGGQISMIYVENDNASYIYRNVVTTGQNHKLGQISMADNPIEDMEIATKKYVDDKECILKSTTPGSTKKFKITVDDSGTIKATEVT